VDSKAEQKQPETACTFKEAKAYCQQLNLDGKRWRLPSRTALMSLIDTSHADLKRRVYATYPYAFPTDFNQNLHFLASNEFEPGDRSFVPNVVLLLLGGATRPLDQDANVKCVHSIFSGSSTTEDHFRGVLGSDFVLDTRTHLEWERSVPDTSLTYADAVVRCHNLGERFRIPSARELISLYGEVRFIHQLHPAFVPGSSVSIFWTSDYNITDPADHLVVFGTVGTVDPSSAIEETIRMTNATGNGEVAPPIFVARCVRTAADKHSSRRPRLSAVARGRPRCRGGGPGKCGQFQSGRQWQQADRPWPRSDQAGCEICANAAASRAATSVQMHGVVRARCLGNAASPYVAERFTPSHSPRAAGSASVLVGRTQAAHSTQRTAYGAL
jgi:hypothetical protein